MAIAEGLPGIDVAPDVARCLTTDFTDPDIAAIVIEPVQGEGGFVAAPVAFMVALRALCDQHGIVLIADEIQCGAGRTGSFFAMEQMGVNADLIVFGKSIAGGLPLAGVAGKAAIMDAPVPGGLGGTYAGNPLACAAALAVLRAFDEQGLLNAARELGKDLRYHLEEITSALGIHCRIRGLGAMVALELFDDTARRIPSARMTKQLIQSARERGLLLLACGPYANVIRFLMPLTIPRPVLLEGLEILAACLATLDNHTVVGQL
ncbi:4-aminobutyrate aminotransferase-like enzyme [Pseudomonas sp. W4I3]|nr:4-aminobutyrate aminotransferase-like enzyme [Pseudomonas sp. W4I3]